MSIESDLQDKILAISGIDSYVGTNRVYPVFAPETATQYIVYRRINTDYIYNCGFRDSLLRSTFRVTCWTANHDDVVAMANVLRDGMDVLHVGAKGGTSWGTVTVHGAFLANETDEFTPSVEIIEYRLHGRSLDYEIHYEQDIPN